MNRGYVELLQNIFSFLVKYVILNIIILISSPPINLCYHLKMFTMFLLGLLDYDKIIITIMMPKAEITFIEHDYRMGLYVTSIILFL